LIPVTFIIPYLFAGSADGEKATQFLKAVSKNVIPAKLVLDLIGEQESISF